jgi:hypothetical protein
MSESTRIDRITAASSLAAANPGTQFYVLEATESVTQPVSVIRQSL